MPSIPDEFLSEINRRTDIADLVSDYVELKNRGSRMVGLCPFHSEKTGSFTVFPDTNSYYCFGCGAGGGPINFLRQIESLDFTEAVKMLADRAGLQMPDTGYDNGMAKLKQRIYEINRHTARFYNACLFSENGKAVYEYFKSRNLSDATIKHFGLGASPDGWDNLIKHLRSLGYSDDEMLQANVVMRSQKGGIYDRFRNRAMFPILDLRGNVIAFGGRVLPQNDDKKGAKYINTSDTPVFKKSHCLYALNFAKQTCSQRIILAEGYMDVIALHQVGITNAVAALGTAFGEEHALLLSRYTSEIVLTLDADDAGKRATDRALQILSKSGIPVRVLRIPDGKDPDEFIRKHGKNAANAFRDLLDGSMNGIEYKLADAAKGTDISTDRGKLEYVRRCIDILATQSDNVAADLYAGKLAENFGISKDTILTQIKQKRRSINKKSGQKAQREIINPKHDRTDVNTESYKYPRAAAAEEKIISILIYSPDLLESALQKITADDFVTDFNKRVFVRLTEVIQNGMQFDAAILGADFTPEECGRVAKYRNYLPKGENAKRELADCTEVLKNEKLRIGVSSQMSTDEWAQKLKEVANNKK